MITESGNKEHHKHAKLVHAAYGEWARNELSVLGAPCGVIQMLATQVIAGLRAHWNIAFADTDHHAAVDESALPGYLDQMHSRRLTFTRTPNSFERRALFNDLDLVLVNGNHFAANAQIIIIDEAKPLTKKLDQLTEVVLILLKDKQTAIPQDVKDAVTDFDKVPVLSIDDTAAILSFVDEFLKQRIPRLNGLVLAGGKSTRMGTDKGLLQYHGTTQRKHVYQLLQHFCGEVYLSCNREQRCELTDDLKVIEDQFLGLGPMGGILSAMQSNPDAAWIVVACDLPFLNEATLRYLIDHRNPAKFATALMNEVQGFPEPMIAIWEPRSYPLLLQYLSMGYSCPRKVLINSDIELLTLPDQQALENINEPEGYREALHKLNHE